jgi:2-polyprenyl-3-methyl-5-hydroxy-6-metoxy-1,4-benzoquinol methylase
MRCTACGHVYTDGYFEDEALAVLFSKVHAAQQAGYDLENQRYVSARMVEKVLPFAREGRWLDVGFGNASLLMTAQEYGFVPVGIDMRAANVAALRSFGIEAQDVDLEKFDPPSRFRVMSLCDVLEHVPYPRACLDRARALLEDDGVLFVSMPNSESALWRVLDQHNVNPYWGEMEHYHNFSRTRLYALLRETGFEPLRFGISERYRVCMEVVARRSK